MTAFGRVLDGSVHPGDSRRILVLAPYGKDARLSSEILHQAGMETAICQDAADMCLCADVGCGAWLLAEEALLDDEVVQLRDWLRAQPSWSEVPIILVTGGGEASLEQRRRLAVLGDVGNVTQLERPFRKGTLISTMEMALRSRDRQYQVRELVEQTQRDTAALRDAAQRKDEFLAMLAHELRNPLSSISNAALLLNGDTSEEEHSWAASVIRRQSGQLARLVDDLLDVSRITRGKIELRRRSCDVADVLTAACETVESLIKGRGHTLHAELHKGRMWLDADPTRVEQIFVNLLGNAAKYTTPNGHIWLSVRAENSVAVITVRDSGIGISPERVDDMFDLFAQGDRTAARSEGGLGIGLTVVKGLCELHGGSVQAESAGLDQGSVFTVRLPLAPPPSPAHSDPSRPSIGAVLRGSRILVVDDNFDSARGLSRLLKLKGYVVEVAHDGPTAIDKALQFGPAAVLLDIGLPGMDGYEVARLLRSDGGCAETFVVALTGYGQAEDRARARASGFDEHLVKPIDFETLLLILQNGLCGK